MCDAPLQLDCKTIRLCIQTTRGCRTGMTFTEAAQRVPRPRTARWSQHERPVQTGWIPPVTGIREPSFAGISGGGDSSRITRVQESPRFAPFQRTSVSLQGIPRPRHHRPSASSTGGVSTADHENAPDMSLDVGPASASPSLSCFPTAGMAPSWIQRITSRICSTHERGDAPQAILDRFLA